MVGRGMLLNVASPPKMLTVLILRSIGFTQSALLSWVVPAYPKRHIYSVIVSKSARAVIDDPAMSKGVDAP